MSKELKLTSPSARLCPQNMPRHLSICFQGLHRFWMAQCLCLLSLSSSWSGSATFQMLPFVWIQQNRLIMQLMDRALRTAWILCPQSLRNSMCAPTGKGHRSRMIATGLIIFWESAPSSFGMLGSNMHRCPTPTSICCASLGPNLNTKFRQFGALHWEKNDC